jgi:hypothetical protein
LETPSPHYFRIGDDTETSPEKAQFKVHGSIHNLSANAVQAALRRYLKLLNTGQLLGVICSVVCEAGEHPYFGVGREKTQSRRQPLDGKTAEVPPYRYELPGYTA